MYSDWSDEDEAEEDRGVDGDNGNCFDTENEDETRTVAAEIGQK